MRSSESRDDSEISSVVEWGRVKQFVQKLGKTPDSQSLSLSHCDLTATDLVELGERSDSDQTLSEVMLSLVCVSFSCSYLMLCSSIRNLAAVPDPAGGDGSLLEWSARRFSESSERPHAARRQAEGPETERLQTHGWRSRSSGWEKSAERGV